MHKNYYSKNCYVLLYVGRFLIIRILRFLSKLKVVKKGWSQSKLYEFIII